MNFHELKLIEQALSEALEPLDDDGSAGRWRFKAGMSYTVLAEQMKAQIPDIKAQNITRAVRSFPQFVTILPAPVPEKQKPPTGSERLAALEQRLDALTDRVQHLDMALQRFLAEWQEYMGDGDGRAAAA